MTLKLYATVGALALATSPAIASTLPPSALLNSSGTLSFNSATGFQAEGDLRAEYRAPPLGARPYIFSTSLSFGALTITPDLTLTTPEIVVIEPTRVCLPFIGCNTIPGVTIPSQTLPISPDLPLANLGTVYDGSVRSPALPVGDVFAFDYGTPLLGVPLSFGQIVQDQFETGDATVSVSGGIGPFNSMFDYDGTLNADGDVIMADYALSITGPGILGDLETFALGLINDNIDQFAGLAFDLFLGTDPCGSLSPLAAGTCNTILAGLDPNAFLLTVNSIGTLSADYTLNKSIAPVPLPAALPLMGGGLALLGMMGWRRRRYGAA